ncbi:D-alanyl-D-alanine carboxypeptidase [Streptomyces sp. NPDC059979]|uniref:D-alanyl-D-alanine carboxypeptidase family protein n=2 Tax=unclassified Streptomyces TaxID=2593676 RepID=UPI003680A230
MFRAVKPGSASAPAAAPVRKPEPAADEPADSERTAVFRAVKPGSASGPAAAPTREPRPAAERPADSESTAVFRAPKPVPAPATEEAADSERTAVFRAVKPDAAKPDAVKPDAFRRDAAKPDAAKPPTAPSSGAAPDAAQSATPAPPKGSTFVPLRPQGGSPGPQAGQLPPKAPAPAGPPARPAPPAPAAPAAPAAPSASLSAAERLARSERTTQQPLPPKPPLDMLADLTNNPPPPPSPMRTAVRRFKIYAPLVVLLAIVLAVVQLVRPLPEPKLVMTATSSYTFEGSKPQLPWPSEGQAYMAAAGLGTLGQSGEQKPVPIASVTKSMTAYIILRDHPIKKGEQGAMIDIDKTAETEGKKNDSVNNESTLDTVKEGEKISEYDAIAALMIPSANNIARLLARWDSGSQEAFVKKMNDTAKELGMTKTTYTDPSGLDATTVSTAEDQVKLGLKLVEMETLLDITKKPSWVDPSGKNWPNWNRLVPYNDSLGIKTGTTTKAGGNLLFAAQKKIGNTNQLIVGAVLGQHKAPIIDTVIAASKQLMLATQKALEGATVVKKGQVVGYVDDGLGNRTPVVATADVQAVGWASLTVDVKLANGGGKLPQTAKAGTEVGVLTVGEGASQVKVPVALQSDLAAPGIGSKLTRIG